MNLHRVVVVLVLGGLLALTPLAHASPPDQTWIAGFYDDADYDDVVLLITSGESAVQLEPLPVLVPVSLVVALVAAPHEALPESSQLSGPSRAPPLS